MPLSIDTPVLDLIYRADAQPTPEQLADALGDDAAKTRMVLDVDVDVPQYEMEISPTVMLRKRGERRLLVVDETAQPMRKNPQQEPIVPKDLRAERERLVRIVEKTGARLGRLQAFGSFGDAVIVAREAVDLRACALLAWALDPVTDVEGRRRAQPLGQREFEEKLKTFPARLLELDDATILSRIAPAAMEKRGEHGELLVVDVLSDRDGSWDVRKSYELEQRLAALELFARIPGARVQAPAAEDTPLRADARPTPPTPAPAEPPAAAARPAPAASPAPAAPPPAATPPPPAAPPVPAGPPITVTEIAGRVVLIVPAERLDADTLAAISRKNLDLLRSGDTPSGQLRDRMHTDGYGFVAPLAFLSEVFIDGKPLDRKRFEADARPGPSGTRLLEVHLPRFGPALLLDGGPGRRFITSELATDPTALLAAVGA